MVGFLIGFTQQLRFEHREVIGNRQPHLVLGPVFSSLWLLLFLFLALLDDHEAELAQDKVGLPWRFTATELVGSQSAPHRVTAGQANDRLRCVLFSFVNQEVAGWLAKGVLNPGVEVRQGFQNVLVRQSSGNGLRHDRYPVPLDCSEDRRNAAQAQAIL
jgi:hypothetical protein